MSAQPLHPKQSEILEILRRGVEGLSLRDIAAEIGLSSPNTVLHHIRQLEKKGMLRRNPLNPSEYNLLADPIKDLIYVNLYGSAQCGPEGLFGEDNIEERIPISTRLFGVDDQVFLVRARGNSMEPHIQNDDLVLARHNTQPNSGTLCVVVHNHQPKIKKLLMAGDAVILSSLNPRFAPETVTEDDSFYVVGEVRSMIRFYR
jgi:repressor LexA